MKKNKYLLLLLCICMLFGCGKKQDAPPDTTELTTEKIAATQTEATTEEMTEEVTEATTEEVNPREDILISIDPGHQGPAVDMSAKEPNAPGSDVMKTKATSGTTGAYTGVPEYQLNLDISLQLRDALTALGYQVVMTREDNDTAISNAERASLANDAGADVAIRIHANGSEDKSTNGALVLVGSERNPYVGSLYAESKRLGESVLNAYCDATGMKNLGIQTNDTMTGINWSTIPVMILEMGFMTNETDDNNMQDKNYQALMVSGIVQGIDSYFGINSEADVSSGENTISG